MKFPYDLELVAKIKALPKRYYIVDEKTWEVPVTEINNLISIFGSRKIELVGKVTTKGKAEIARAVFDSIDALGYKFKTTPYQHQIEGLTYGLANNRFLLADEQGLGKTKQSIDIAVARKSQFKHCLIVTGVNGLKWNWMKEIGIHSDEKAVLLGARINKKGKTVVGSVKERLEDLCAPHDEYFLVTNIETLRYQLTVKDEKGKNKTTYPMQEKLEAMTLKGEIGMVIVDEIHKCKNATSLQGKAIHCLKSFYKIALTGTPLMNKPLDLYNVLKWLGAETHSYYEFRNHFAIMGGFGGYEVVGYKNLDQLTEQLGKSMLRRKKDEVLDLPEKIRSTEYVELLPKQAQLYKEAQMEILANIDQIKLSPNPLAQLIRLRQATGYTGILSSTIKESAKLDRMEELVEDAIENGEKVIVFSNWTSMTDEIGTRLAKYNPAFITGQVKDTHAQMEKFQTDETCKVIIGTIGAMGTGYTLTAGSTVIFTDKPWNMANTEQAEDRAHRIGTKRTVNIITLVTKDTIDERIEEIVYEKGAMADMIVDGKIKTISTAKVLEMLLN